MLVTLEMMRTDFNVLGRTVLFALFFYQTERKKEWDGEGKDVDEYHE